MCTDEGESPLSLSLFVRGEEGEGTLLIGNVDLLGPNEEERKDNWCRSASGCKPLGGGTALGGATGSFLLRLDLGVAPHLSVPFPWKLESSFLRDSEGCFIC